MIAITTLFNPCGYKRLVENYHRFREQLDVPLITVEMSLTGEFEVADSIQLHATKKNVMWQKERMINVGIAALPLHVEHFAWIDADLIFHNKNWVEQTMDRLGRARVVHLFEELSYLDPAGKTIRDSLSYVAAGRRRIPPKWTTVGGGAWASHRDQFPTGLWDYDVIGGGDSAALYAWTGRFSQIRKLKWTQSHRSVYRDWALDQHKRVGGKLEFVPGKVDHLYHGSKENRKYSQRHDILARHGYDPLNDVKVGENGLWEWCNDRKWEMHSDVAKYFLNRREDD